MALVATRYFKSVSVSDYSSLPMSCIASQSILLYTLLHVSLFHYINFLEKENKKVKVIYVYMYKITCTYIFKRYKHREHHAIIMLFKRVLQINILSTKFIFPLNVLQQHTCTKTIHMKNVAISVLYPDEM